MKTPLLLTSLVALGIGTAAVAAPHGLRADANQDGTVTRAELVTKMDQRFAKLDVNRDGRISADELTQAKERRSERRAKLAAAHPERAAKRQARMDKRQARGGARGPQDLNGDGVITRDEFGNKALARFERVDANHDGSVTAAERATARAARKAQRG